MHGRLFTLISADNNDDGIFAWGIEITHQDSCEAVTYRRDPESRQATHGVHNSAETARDQYSRLIQVPLTLLYMDYTDEIALLS